MGYLCAEKFFITVLASLCNRFIEILGDGSVVYS